ncbi:MAG: glycosyltransferase family 2 protein [Bacteroidota bacterium]
MNQKVNVISVNYNSAKDILHCIASLKPSTYRNFQLFVVDNCSTDHSISTIENGGKELGFSVVSVASEELGVAHHQDALNNSDVVLIANANNQGFAAGNNVAIRYLLQNRKNEFIWLLNPDVEVEKGVMEDLVSLHGDRERVLVGNLIHYFNNREKVMYWGGFAVKKWVHGIRNIRSKEQQNKIDAIAGASLFTRMETFADLGVLPEEYFLYWEETDFCTKAKKGGYQFDVNGNSKIFDRVGSSANTNFTREYLYILSGLRYYRKFYGWHLPIILLSTFAKQLKAILSSSGVKRKAIYLGHVDFFKLLLGRKLNIKERIKNNR